MTRPTVETALDPHQRLAAAVIRQAIEDASEPRKPEAGRRDARAFLDDPDTLRHWCTLAGVDEEWVRRRGRERR